MSNQTPPRAEYLARIHRVMDFVETHLGDELPLERLAGVACFSPFHFHRIFGALTGETVQRFIQRLRLERAATQLLANPAKSVTAVALDCGFSSSAAFARAFREAFGCSAGEWRAVKGKPDCANSDSKLRKVGKTDRKHGEAVSGGIAYPDGINHTGGSTMHTTPATTDKQPIAVRVEELAPFPVAYVRHAGSYQGNGELFAGLFDRLCRWAGPRGFLGPGARMLSVYHDNPEITDAGKLRVSVAVSVPPGTEGSGEVGIMEIPGGKYAFLRFTVTMGDYGAAWNHAYGTWLPGSGYQPDDRAPMEFYLGEPDTDGQHEIELVVPVKPMD
jgi:AraC family transcriptional regulator